MKQIQELTEANLNEIKQVLDQDGIIIFPTDTVYGICARMKSKKAHDNLIKVILIIGFIKMLTIVRVAATSIANQKIETETPGR